MRTKKMNDEEKTKVYIQTHNIKIESNMKCVKKNTKK